MNVCEASKVELKIIQSLPSFGERERERERKLAVEKVRDVAAEVVFELDLNN